MADLTSGLNALTNALNSLVPSSSSARTQADLLIEAYKRTQSGKLDQLKNRKSTLERKSSFLNSLRSKLNVLQTQIDKFSLSSSSDYFVTRKVTSSDSSYVTASATTEANLGTNSVKVNRLASNDLLISAKLSSSAQFSVNGSNLNFIINGKTVNVTINVGTTNEQALSIIASAINNTNDINAYASVVKDTNTTVRLTITAKNTGSENRITFNDNGSGVLNALGFDNVDPNANIRTPTQSGNQYAHFKISDISQLDSEAEINGIPIIRGSNSLSDVISGLTINLNKVQDSNAQPITLTTEVDISAVQSHINSLLNAFNETLQFLNANKNLLKDEPFLRNLITSLRVIPSQEITSAEPGNPRFLSEIGIRTNPDGTLTLSNISKLEENLKSNSIKVSDIFVSSDSFVKKLKNVLSPILTDTNFITSKATNAQTQVQEVQRKIAEFEAKLEIQAENYKNDYFRSLEAYLKAQSQFSSFYSTANTLLTNFIR
ncbi:MAG: flagellar filament capping protein FliD [Ignavibacteria bacterium]|nr:flagellar filament capping protein FliD [Ignavibacteria bacterium]